MALCEAMVGVSKKLVPPLAPMKPPLGDGAQYDNPSVGDGNISSSQWGCHSCGGEAPRA